MSVFAPALSSLWQQIEDCGIDPQPLFRQNGINASMPFDPNARMSYHKVDRIMATAVIKTGDPFFGLREEEYFLPSHLGALGFAWLASSDLRVAMERLQRYIKVINETIRVSLCDDKNSFIVSIQMTKSSENALHRDGGCLAALTKMCRFICGAKWSPLRVTLSHPEPADTTYYLSLFRCPVEFGAAQNSIHIDSRQAGETLSGSNEQLAQLNDHIVVRYLAFQARDDIVSQVKATILESLGEGNVSEASVADKLHMSTRTLNRKLKAEDSSFKTLLFDTRSELANQYLNDATLTLTEISYMLGFSEISSFSRAYRRWTGQSPSAARKTQSFDGV
jgi:AraC-like DNA-binding protein